MIWRRTSAGQRREGGERIGVHRVAIGGGSLSAWMNEPAFGSTLSSPSECHPQPARFMPIGLLSFSTFETTSTSG
jgi:hypothetical protein